jgi:hypothetical protein
MLYRRPHFEYDRDCRGLTAERETFGDARLGRTAVHRWLVTGEQTEGPTEEQTKGPTEVLVSVRAGEAVDPNTIPNGYYAGVITPEEAARRVERLDQLIEIALAFS